MRAKVSKPSNICYLWSILFLFHSMLLTSIRIAPPRPLCRIFTANVYLTVPCHAYVFKCKSDLKVNLKLLKLGNLMPLRTEGPLSLHVLMVAMGTSTLRCVYGHSSTLSVWLTLVFTSFHRSTTSVEFCVVCVQRAVKRVRRSGARDYSFCIIINIHLVFQWRKKRMRR